MAIGVIATVLALKVIACLISLSSGFRGGLFLHRYSSAACWESSSRRCCWPPGWISRWTCVYRKFDSA
jgi:hypothetical protein